MRSDPAHSTLLDQGKPNGLRTPAPTFAGIGVPLPRPALLSGRAGSGIGGRRGRNAALPLNVSLCSRGEP